MNKNKQVFVILLIVSLFLLTGLLPAFGDAGEPVSVAEKNKASIAFADNMTESMKWGAEQVTDDLKDQARSLFEHTPLGWDVDTLDYFSDQALSLPTKLPVFIEEVLEQSRVLGFAGSVIVFIFLVAVIYSLIGRKRVLVKAEQTAKPLFEKLPEEVYPFLMLGLLSVTAALIPLLLFGMFSLIKAFISYDAPWFLLTGRLLALWSIGALLISLIRGIVDQKIFFIQTEYGDTIFRLFRLIVLYVLFGIAVLWSAEAFGRREDFLAFLRFLIYLSIVLFLFIILLRKKAVLSLLPQLPNKSYQSFLKGFDRYYYPVMGLTLLTGVMWCFGYKRFSTVLWTKTWGIAGVYIGFSLVYYIVIQRLQRWADSIDKSDEHARTFVQSLKGFILYISIIITALVMTDLLGILEPIRRIISFPIVSIGSSPLSLWIIAKAGLILVIFIYVSRMLCAYLNYKIYPAMKVESGTAYAIDTFLKYFMLLLGGFIALEIVGFDLRALLVFAGAIGIGLGLALQSMASNLISGFAIIFGGKIRRGDWLEVGETMGMVSDIDLRATKVRTRDNIEYIIPNADLMSNTIINYSLSSPMIRIDVPFGVAYASDPRKVEQLVMETAEKDPEVMVSKKPEFRFIGYGDNSIDFQLLVWIDVRRTARRHIRSKLYFAMFEAFAKEGIEIPFPQQDVHFRSGIEWERFGKPEPA
ncbi:MAG: mechanosensitive ion channel [Desulfobacteraceae bacterium]|nr:mechanosensitive ion channel [Desulfobacteraceae bacterium]MBC2756207.1 mechanosensitive ion channel [Desulfobacteraceae bacterium]